LVYDATGHVFFQAVSGLAASPEARGHWSAADSSALRALLASAAAYFGTYVAHPQQGSVIHRIEGEIPPNRGTTEIATPYELRGDTLILGQDSTAHWKFLRVQAVSRERPPPNDR
jgi:Lipocalin-like domain